MAKKVGIMTLFYKTYNFGAQLQAYALQRAIEKLGFEAEQIRYQWSRVQTRINYENCSVSRERFEDFARQIPHSEAVYTPQDIYDAAGEYDCFVCGSDQIWGVKASMPPYSLPHMTLSFVPEEKIKIAYAASFGSTVLDSETGEIIRDPLNRLDAISIREGSGKGSLRGFTSEDIETVLDPTLLLDTEEWNRVAAGADTESMSTAAAAGADTESRYLLVYNISDAREIDDLAYRFAEQHSVRMIKIGYADGREAGPREFVRYIKDAEYVLTDSFHGTVFSILYHKRFLACGNDKIDGQYSKNVRITDLLGLFGLERHFCMKPDDRAPAVLADDMDGAEIERILNEQREKSLAFLLRNLSADKRMDAVSLPAPKAKCTGCGICAAQCPQKAITMKPDKLGFLYPHIDRARCTGCNRCGERCPVRAGAANAALQEEACGGAGREVYSFTGEAHIARKSSSGGAFYYLAREILSGGGIVYGAAYDERFHVVHKRAENMPELDDLLRSKYVQSDLRNTFDEIRETTVHHRRKALFCGTPCQVAALKAYVGDTELLYTVDLICGGVTSPALWDKYLAYRAAEGDIGSINMRSKALGVFLQDGHISFHMEIGWRDGTHTVFRKEDDLFLYTRLRQAFYRECCYACRYKGEAHPGDITIGDYIDYNLMYPEEDVRSGVSCVILNTEKGRRLFEGCEAEAVCRKRDLQSVVLHNAMYDGNLAKTEIYDYLRGGMRSFSLEKLFAEARRTELFCQNENMLYSFYLELKRNALIDKIRLFQEMELSVNDVPYVRGKILIYGAGKAGRLLAGSVESGFLGFVDSNPELKSADGYPVYHPCGELADIVGGEPVDAADGRLVNAAAGSGDITVIVTPIWDFAEIKERIGRQLPGCAIISAERIVEGL